MGVLKELKMNFITLIPLGILLGVGVGYLLSTFLNSRKDRKFNDTIVETIKKQDVTCGVENKDGKVEVIHMVDLLPSENIEEKSKKFKLIKWKNK